MDFRSNVKQLLRMCGHAFVSTVHERLDGFERQVEKLAAQSLSLAETQTALLQASIHIVENLNQMRDEIRCQAEELRRRNEEFILVQVPDSLKQIHDDVRRSGEELRRQNEEFIAVQVSDSLRQIHDDVDRQREELRRQCEEFISINVLNNLRQIHDDLRCQGQDLRRQDEEFISAHVLSTLRQIQDDLRRQGEATTHQVSIETSDYEFANPETGLMAHLYSVLPTRRALDVGAHVGDVSESLLRSGYEVYAFEPNQPVYERLIRRLGKHRDFHPFNFALSCGEGEMPLYLAEDVTGAGRYGDVTVYSSLVAHSMPGDLPFTSTRTVVTRKLANLQREGLIPADLSLVKIDTEGFDLEVIRGMGDIRCPVVAAEYWDKEVPFGKSGLLYTLESLVDEMKALGYRWHVVLYRVWGQNVTAFYCNHPRPIPNSWGNVVFFRDYDIFLHGQEWCSATLPRTFFKAAPAK